ncbi:CRTAC1 family protein [Natrarchaeobius chitinivorans]|uniref:CRTAC1 family protein n=1 Tax=Natrarchaeobius chitinivorans TaxID=1679083 RepID=A0A3N6M3Q5_NATCH|nr:CRTAC1 family protein [Natrarchaeobius chitinivorans]RQG95084.1 CRTAC1 family protein [Natrarchaeobius chitinivorans]
MGMGAVVLAVIVMGCVGVPVQDVDGHGAEEPTTDDYGFEEVATERGLEYESINIGAVNGNDGVYAVDYTNSRETDLLAIGGGEPVLFENTGGEFERSGDLPPVEGTAQGALFFDHDNDGWEDLLLLRRGGTPVFFENDEGTFRERDVGFDDEFVVPVSASAADATGNGCPDVFVLDYGDWLDEHPRGWHYQLDFPAEEDNGELNALYTGDCGEFDRVDDAGIEGEHWSMATSFVDLTGDGHPDIHVANDYFEDEIYYNRGDGTFDREYLGNETNRNGMSSSTADVTGDGQLEIFVTNIYYPRDRWGELPDTQRQLFVDFMTARIGDRNQGNNLLVRTDEGFVDQGEERGLNEGGWGWGAAVEDFDGDGQVDVFHATQFQARFDEGQPTFVRPMVFAQQNGQFHRLDASELGLEEVDERGVAALDFDSSGSMDVAVAGSRASYRLYSNDAEQGDSLQVVVGGAEDLDHTTLGTTVEATVDGDSQLRVRNARADYQSQDTRTLHFGFGEADTVDELRVTWPDGTELTLEDVETGQRIHVTPDGIDERRSYA